MKNTEEIEQGGSTTEVPLIMPTRRSIHINKVAGKEYIFTYSGLPGYFILRCEENTPGTWKDNPFKRTSAIAHFNAKKFTCHDTTRGWNRDEILMHYGIPVVRGSSEDIDDTWVKKMNEIHMRRVTLQKEEEALNRQPRVRKSKKAKKRTRTKKGRAGPRVGHETHSTSSTLISSIEVDGTVHGRGGSSHPRSERVPTPRSSDVGTSAGTAADGGTRRLASASSGLTPTNF